MEPINNISHLLANGEIEAAEQSALAYLDEKGHYFYDAPLVYKYLADIYLTQKRYEDAFITLEKNVEFQDNPNLYQRLAELAIQTNKNRALTYAEEAVQSAIRNDWNVVEYKRWLTEIKEEI